MLFDLDGTLIDSSLLHARAFKSVIRESLPEMADAFEYDLVRGKTTVEVFRELGVAEGDRVQTLAAQKQNEYRASVERGELVCMEGAKELLSWLKGQGIGVHLVTGSSKRSVSVALESTGLKSFFDVTVTADDIERGKPAPEPYALCVRLIDGDPSGCFAVEDAISGVESAHAAGIQAIGVFDRQIEDAADFWFSSLTALHTSFRHAAEVMS